jgi:hypothetical protein
MQFISRTEQVGEKLCIRMEKTQRKKKSSNIHWNRILLATTSWKQLEKASEQISELEQLEQNM